jgi:hypothetical protein
MNGAEEQPGVLAVDDENWAHRFKLSTATRTEVAADG